MIADMLGKNIYVDPWFTLNISSKVKSELIGTLKYEYDKFFSVGFSGSYAKVDKYLFFYDSSKPAIFSPLTESNVDDFYIKLDMLFHPAQFGYFHGEVKYQEVKDGSGKFIPYQPKYSSKLIYGYDFEFGLGVKAGYQFAYDIFTDIANTDKLENYQNLSFGISYKLWENLSLTADFQNILNKSNFVWKGYEEKPFDILVGAEYRW
jgi:outer membrane receptor protein involved in Fe transport